jgi:predicted nuclease with TOPRIM domain
VLLTESVLETIEILYIIVSLLAYFNITISYILPTDHSGRAVRAV